jgi:hypothetical protein
VIEHLILAVVTLMEIPKASASAKVKDIIWDGDTYFDKYCQDGFVNSHREDWGQRAYRIWWGHWYSWWTKIENFDFDWMVGDNLNTNPGNILDRKILLQA